ncbi:hypothetical protein ACWF94_00795 [Streptomyces sp. NPDC055078]
MTRDAITTTAPDTRLTVTVCGHPTGAPVPIRWIQTQSGSGHTLYACPPCAVLVYDHGPQWEDEIHPAQP